MVMETYVENGLRFISLDSLVPELGEKIFDSVDTDGQRYQDCLLSTLLESRGIHYKGAFIYCVPRCDTPKYYGVCVMCEVDGQDVYIALFPRSNPSDNDLWVESLDWEDYMCSIDDVVVRFTCRSGKVQPPKWVMISVDGEWFKFLGARIDTKLSKNRRNWEFYDKAEKIQFKVGAIDDRYLDRGDYLDDVADEIYDTEDDWEWDNYWIDRC